METITLQGITAPGGTAKEKIYRELLGIQMGAETGGKSAILASLSRQDLRGAECLCEYLESQENGGAILDEIFKDAASFDTLGRQIFKIADLMTELDAIPFEKRFEGFKEARNMLAGLSLKLKQTSRLAARRTGKIGSFR